MSLFLEERIKEQNEVDPANDNVIFTHKCIISYDEEFLETIYSFRTTYQFGSETWLIILSDKGIEISANGKALNRIWNGSSCFISYDLYYDKDMRFMLHSSMRIKMTKDTFVTPDGFMKKFLEAVRERKLSKMVIFVELQLPSKYLYLPFDYPLGKELCDKYPPDMENHYKFVFLKLSDYSFKCSDGEVPALKIVLEIRSKFMKLHLSVSNDNEFVMDFSVDVVKPVIYFLHSLCFEMPTSYDIDFVKRLFEVINLFEPEHKHILVATVHQSICQKFVEKTTYKFDVLLRWLTLACQNSFYDLANMIITLITEKYYFKWHQTFPENARNIENPIYRDFFGLVHGRMCLWVFREIEEIMMDSFQTNMILP